MNPQELERQAQLQAAAEQAERLGMASADPEVERYRAVIRALRRPLPMQLPADFARQVAEQAERRHASAGLEAWLTRTMMLLMIVVGLALALPTLGTALETTMALMPRLPIGFVVAAVLSVGAVWLIDLGWTRGHAIAA